jgi:hypothetical protein
MEIPDPRTQHWFERSKELRDLQSDPEGLKERLRGSGGGDNHGGMSDDWKKSVEDRLGELRSDVREVKSDTTNLKVDVATIKENLRHLPTKPWMFTTLATMVMVIIALITFITGMMIRFLPHAS